MKRRTINIYALLIAILLQTVVQNASAAAIPDKNGKAMLYNANCAICHGQAKRGQSPLIIHNAIRKNTGGMGSLRFLTTEQVHAIASF